MPQDRNSGKQANDWGRNCAGKVAKAIGTHLITTNSNEAVFNNERVVIKCAHKNTNSVGVSHEMINRLDAVVGAFENADGKFRVLRLPARLCVSAMTPTRSRGPSAGKVGIVKRTLFDDEGTLIGIFKF